MNTRRETYKNEIHQYVRKIASVCLANGIPAFMSFEDEAGFRVTHLNQDQARTKHLQHLQWLNETASIDDFLDRIIEDAKANGHDSAHLRAMGIPSEPNIDRYE